MIPRGSPASAAESLPDSAVATLSATPRQHSDEAPWIAVYTRSFRELRVYESIRELPVLDALIPVHLASRQRRQPGAGRLHRDGLLFTNYVFLRARFSADLRRRLLAIDGLEYLVGVRHGFASPIPDAQMRLVRGLMESELPPRLAALPEKGRRARIVSGPLQGVDGIVLSRGKGEVRLAARICLVGQYREITVPLEFLELAGWWECDSPLRRRHRGGRRTRRCNVRLPGDTQVGG